MLMNKAALAGEGGQGVLGGLGRLMGTAPWLWLELQSLALMMLCEWDLT